MQALPLKFTRKGTPICSRDGFVPGVMLLRAGPNARILAVVQSIDDAAWNGKDTDSDMDQGR
jgi:hypothetical protein